jgi:hypothetical protein
MFIEWLEKIPELLKFGWGDLAKVFIGVFLAGFLALKWMKAIRRATKAQIEAEKHKLAAELATLEARFQTNLGQETARFLEQVASLQVRHAEERLELQQDQIALQQACRQAEEERDHMQARLD